MSYQHRKMSMRGLRTFCVAARHRTLVNAADELFVTPSAVSHQLKKLEGELGFGLFQRVGRGLVLTDAGEALYERIQEPMLQVETAAGEVRARFARGRLSVSVQPFFASELLMPALADFSEAHPEVDLSLDASDDATQVLPPTADLAIRLYSEPPKDVKGRQLLPLSLVPACSPQLKKQLEQQPQASQALFPVVVHAARPNAWKRWAAQSGVALPLTGSVIRLDAMSAIVQAAERGLGVALVPLQLTRAAFESGRLVQLFDHALETTDAYWIVWRPGVAKRPDVRSFRSWVVERFAELPDVA